MLLGPEARSYHAKLLRFYFNRQGEHGSIIYLLPQSMAEVRASLFIIGFWEAHAKYVIGSLAIIILDICIFPRYSHTWLSGFGVVNPIVRPINPVSKKDKPAVFFEKHFLL